MSVLPDFEKYSLIELLEVRDHVDKESYPERYQEILNLISEKKSFAGVDVSTVAGAGSEIDKYLTFWPRFWALVLDGILFSGVIFVESLVFGFAYDAQDDLFQAINGIQMVIYTIVMHGFYGQTVGKMLMDVKVLNNADEKNIGILQSLRRESINLFFNICMLVLVLIIFFSDDLDEPITEKFAVGILTFLGLVVIWSISEFVTMLFNRKRRALHDFVGKTVVVRI